MVRLFTRAGDSRDGDFATNAREIRAFAKANLEKNVYLAPNPTCSTVGARHSAKDVTHWSYFLIDMDPVEKVSNPKAALDEALLRLGEWCGRDFEENCPIIIDSGRGMQAWIRLEDVALDDVTPSDTIHSVANDDNAPAVSRSVARRVNGYWLKRLDEELGVIEGCRIDTSVSDLPRVMRCPGTVNIKTGRKSSFVHTTDRIQRGLATLLTVGTPKKVLRDPEPSVVVAGQPWQHVFPNLTRMAQNYLTMGQEEPGRHKVMWHTAKKLTELGVSRKEARKALRWANALKGEREELPEDQVEHALDTAYST